MKIKQKMIVMLLLMTIMPLVVNLVIRQINLHRFRKQVYKTTVKAFEATAIADLSDKLQGYNELLLKDFQLTKSLLEYQKLKVEAALREEPIVKKLDCSDEKFGYLESGQVTTYKYLKDRLKYDSTISYNSQSYHIFGSETPDVKKSLAQLSAMTSVYNYLLAQSDGKLYWQYTVLENGLYTSYPFSEALPVDQGYNPKKRPWYIRAKQMQQTVWTGPIIDAASGNRIITVSTPLTDRDGNFIGVSAIDRRVRDFFVSRRVDHAWMSGALSFLVSIDDSSNLQNSLEVILESGCDKKKDWRKPLKNTFLFSSDKLKMQKMLEDIDKGKSGVVKMPYKGEMSLWAYGRSGGYDGYGVILIVKYSDVIAVADSANKSLLKGYKFSFMITSAMMIIVAILALVIASKRASSFTKPLVELAQASQRFAQGDYDAKVDIKTGDELEELGEIFNDVADKLKERDKMKVSLELAQTIQQNLLPDKPMKVAGLEVAGMCLYADETGGDYYDFIPFDNGRDLTIVLGDVSGHGVYSALLMASARSHLRTLTKTYGADISTILTSFNIELFKDTDDGRFMTVFLGHFNTSNNEFLWGAAGHDPALWVDGQTGECRELGNTGMPAGMFDQASFACEGPIKLKKGDLIVVGSDGIWDARNPEDRMFGTARFREVLKESRSGSAQEICKSVISAVADFVGPAERYDDVTIVVAKV